jgi:hypothetical protein
LTNEASDTVAATAPDWVVVEEVSPSSLIVSVNPRHPSGRPGRTYRLKIEARFQLKVWEVPQSNELGHLPAYCPERHVNGDGSFCLGLTTFAPSAEKLDDFWETVRAYLLCQDFAAKHGRWPSGRWMSHGSSAIHQMEAERAAAAAGISKQYYKALEFGEGWLAGPLTPSIGARTRTRPSSARRIALEALVDAERARRTAEANFTRCSFEWGYRCCETMQNCPLRNYELASRETE